MIGFPDGDSGPLPGPCYAAVMLYIQIKSDRDPRVLADLIASTESEQPVDPKVEVEAKLVREHQAQAERDRPSWQTLDTVNFQKLDDDNDWTDI